MGASPDTHRIEYRLSQNSGGNPIELTVEFQANPQNIVAVDAAAEAAMRALIESLETRYPGAPVGTERFYESRRMEADWSTAPPVEPPVEEPQPPAEPPAEPPVDGPGL
ncbi:hypothetical protein ACFWEH_12840 [Streptomyces anulatus]|uniref:hypothetical protein n=1 Tax=Streptomyces TaxID=1883 RepID=UPI000939AF17|nr:hypothetical protein [Streptomyces sp. TSRI0395]OKI83760.1 hypothetical protein AMK12_11565 [Streptomyces sp. TSRI0395]